MNTTEPSVLPLGFVNRLQSLRDTLLDGLVERDIPVRLGLLAALSGEHLLLIGPPGTAKSLIARRLHLAFGEATYFERLLTRFSVPEELFGPLSIKGLEEDRYERLTDAYLPKASIVFLDEIFKANSAILNALLTLLNEREFDNGTRRDPTPLIAAVGASNELPNVEELDALFDRFLLRVHVTPVSKAGFSSLLGLRGEKFVGVPEQLRLKAADLTAIRQAAGAVSVPDDVLALLGDLREWCMAENISVSDRRWRKVVKLLQTSALTNGRESVSIWDCWLLQYCLWNEPEQRGKVHDWYAARAGASAAMDPSRLTRIVVSWEARLTQDRNSRSQVRDMEGNLQFKDVDGSTTKNDAGQAQSRRGPDLLFLAPSGSNAQNPHHYGQRTPDGADRTAGGKGFSLSQLNKLWVQESPNRWVEFEHWSNRDCYIANTENWLMEEVSLVPLMEPTRQKRAHVSACLQELGLLRGEVATYRKKLVAHIESLDADIRSHLWVSPEFAEPAAECLEGTQREVDTLLARIEKLHQGFEMLPLENDVTDKQPSQVDAHAGVI